MFIVSVPGSTPWMKIGNSMTDSNWYGVHELDKELVSSLRNGQDVEIESKKDGAGHNILTSLKVIDKNAPKEEVKEETPAKEKQASSLPEMKQSIATPKMKKPLEALPEKLGGVGFTDEQAASIATAITLISLSGTFDRNDVHEVIKPIFKTFKDLM